MEGPLSPIPPCNSADNEYDATVKMPSAEFQRIVKDLSTIGDTGTLHTLRSVLCALQWSIKVAHPTFEEDSRLLLGLVRALLLCSAAPASLTGLQHLLASEICMAKDPSISIAWFWSRITHP